MDLFLQTSIILGVTVAVAFIMRLLRQPLVIAYIIAGILCGPVLLNVLNDGQEVFSGLAQLGSVLLLFGVGISLNIRQLRHIGRVALVTGFGQALFTAGLGWLLILWLGYEFTAAFFLALALTFSSTIIIVKFLADKRDEESVYGRYTIGLMLVQDLIAILLLILLPLVGPEVSVSASLLALIAKGIGLVGAIYLLSQIVLPVVLRRVAESGEFLFIFTVAWCFGVAGLVSQLGFSLEIGAVIAGVSLGSSPYQPEIASRIRPLRDFFIILFFVILGSELGIGGLEQTIIPGLILSAFVLIGNPIILFVLHRWFGFTRRNSFLIGLTAAQVSEFGFVLLFIAHQLGYVGGAEMSVFTVVALVTIFISSYFITYNSQLYEVVRPVFEWWGPDRRRDRTMATMQYDVLVFGYHRMGWKLCEALKALKSSFAVVDFNAAAIEKLHRRGIPSYFGDASDVEFVAGLPLRFAKLVICTIPDPADQLVLIRQVRQVNPRAVIVCTLYHAAALEELYSAGANYVMMPHLLGGQWMSEVLKNYPWTKKTFQALRQTQQREMHIRSVAGARD